MKKILMAVAVLLNCTYILAQTEFEAFKMVQTDINGTARYMGMAGAFGALGGDASAIKDNPAGLGIYRKSEFNGTLNLLNQNTNSIWNGVSGHADIYKMNLNNISLVIASPTWRNESLTPGMLSSNLTFAYNRLKSFNRSAKIRSGYELASMTDYIAYFTNDLTTADLKYVSNSYEPFDEIQIPWISILGYEGGLMNEKVENGESSWESFLNPGEKVAPLYTVTEMGFMDEYSFGWAGNFSNIFYLGATANLQTLNYKSYSDYSEAFEGNGGMSLKDTIHTKGAGLNLKIGAIVSPTDFLRLGLSLQTPTILAVNDTYNSTLDYDTYIKRGISTPEGSSSYRIQSPTIVSLSAAFIVGQKGVVSAEYNYTDYKSTRFRDENGTSQSFDAENEGMHNVLNPVRTIKIGGEYRISNNFSLRAGYANSSSANKIDAVKYMRYNTIRTDTEFNINKRIDYLTAGFGYREAGWYVDFAYMNKVSSDLFNPYSSTDLYAQIAPAKVETTNNNLVLTLGFKF